MGARAKCGCGGPHGEAQMATHHIRVAAVAVAVAGAARASACSSRPVETRAAGVPF